jgi:phosphonopyruvate decarboxylase
MMPMREALAVLQAHRKNEVALVVFTAGGPWYETSSRPDLDIPFMGAMGKAGATGLGLAVGRPDVGVWVLDGDGSLLMNLGTLVTEAHMQPRNLVHFVVENGVYGTTGGQPIPGAGVVDFAALARASGFAHTAVFDDAVTLQRELGAVLEHDGPTFVTLKVLPVERRGGAGRKPTKQAIRDVMEAIGTAREVRPTSRSSHEPQAVEPSKSFSSAC